MDEFKKENEKKQGYDEYVKNLKEELGEKGTNPQLRTDTEKKKMSLLMKVGIVLLVVLGIPLLLFGTCMLLFYASGL